MTTRRDGRLGTDHIDLLSLPFEGDGVPYDEAMVAVDDLIRLGKVRCIGAADPSPIA